MLPTGKNEPDPGAADILTSPEQLSVAVIIGKSITAPHSPGSFPWIIASDGIPAISGAVLSSIFTF